jgi:mono/diheme cytochrome c family protein
MAMGRNHVAALFVACLSLASAQPPVGAAPQRASAPAVPSEPRALVDQYCVTCHNDRMKTAGLALDALDLARVPANAEAWEKVVRKVRAGVMPPQGARRPEPAALTGLLRFLETELDRAAASSPNPGRHLAHRLNRAEYANAIEDLLALDITADVASLLPPDDSAYGFDNIADVLGVSPILLERYLSAAGKISALAVGDPDTAAGSVTYRNRQDLSQDRHIEGLPLGTVGGLAVRHTFPVDATYELRVKLFRTNLDAIRGLEYENQLEITVDGTRVFFETVGGMTDLKGLFENPEPYSNKIDQRLLIRVPVTAGPHVISASFLRKGVPLDTRRLQPFIRSSADTYDFYGGPHVERIVVTGPFDITGLGDTPSRQRLFVCRPSPKLTEEACASRILSTVARRAYRQAVSDADLQRLLTFYKTGRQQGSFETGIQLALQRILASPKFVFRAERDPADLAPGTVHRVPDVDLASRLSFFLWSSIPDDELLTLALQGRLGAPGVLERQVRRMLADPRAQALVDNFGSQWLHLRNLQNAVPNSTEFPDFDDNLRQAFDQEARLFFQSIVREDRNVLELLTADYTFVNDRLAKHYGMPYVSGSQFRRVTLTDETRRGLLGKGAVLMATSHADKTSPVLRGKWILENLLGTPPPPPPANVPPLEEKGKDGKPRTMREQMEAHRANPVCATCHKIMDPLGLALENFDAVGAWRTRDHGLPPSPLSAPHTRRDLGAPIDASSQLADGSQVDGAVALRKALLARPEVIVGTVTEKLLTYALGRGLTAADMPAVRAIVRQAGANNYKFSAIVLGISSSTPFQMRVKPPREAVQTARR